MERQADARLVVQIRPTSVKRRVVMETYAARLKDSWDFSPFFSWWNVNPSMLTRQIRLPKTGIFQLSPAMGSGTKRTGPRFNGTSVIANHAVKTSPSQDSFQYWIS